MGIDLGSNSEIVLTDGDNNKTSPSNERIAGFSEEDSETIDAPDIGKDVEFVSLSDDERKGLKQEKNDKKTKFNKKTAVNVAAGLGLLLGTAACTSSEVNNPNAQDAEGDNSPGVSEQYQDNEQDDTEVESYTEDGSVPVGTPTVTPTPTPTQTSTPTPTQTKEPTPTLTPELLVIGEKELIIENTKEEGILQDMVELQKIVNGYDVNSGVEFSEYISRIIKSPTSEGMSEQGHNLLQELENFGEISTMSLIYSLRNSYPELSFLDIPEGHNSIIDALPEEARLEIIDYGKALEQNAQRDSSITRFFAGGMLLSNKMNYNLGLGVIPNILLDGYNYENGFPQFINTLVTVYELEKEGIPYQTGVLINEDNQLILVVLSNEEASKIFPGPYEIYLFADQAFIEKQNRLNSSD